MVVEDRGPSHSARPGQILRLIGPDRARQGVGLRHYGPMRMPRQPAPPNEARPERARELRHARLAAGLTQHQLAAMAGIDQSTIAHYETGGKTPGADRVAYLLGVIAQVRNA